METKRYYGTFQIKKYVRVSAKNRTEARKKMNKKLSTQKASSYLKLEYVEELFY